MDEDTFELKCDKYECICNDKETNICIINDYACRMELYIKEFYGEEE